MTTPRRLEVSKCSTSIQEGEYQPGSKLPTDIPDLCVM